MEKGMEYTTVQKTAEKWGVTVAFVYIAAKDGRISGAKQIDGRWYIPVDAENPAKRKPMDPKKGYISAAEAAKKWNVTVSFVYIAAKDGRISGAKQIEGKWYIPENAAISAKVKPKKGKDGYMSAAEAAKKWDVTPAFVYIAAKAGRIAAAKQIDGRWYIPQDAENPAKKPARSKPGYISSSEAAEKWGITQSSVGAAAKAGRIPDAVFIDGAWHIPENVDTPLNERTARLQGHISVAKAAEKWGVSQRAVHKAAKDGDISDAQKIDGKWHIPENAVCPIRCKKEKNGYRK